MGLVSNGLSERTRCKCGLRVRRMRSWSRKIQGRELQAEGRVSTEPKGRGSLEAGGWPVGLGLGAKEWDSARLGEIFLGLLLHVRCSGKGNPQPDLHFFFLVLFIYLFYFTILY